MAPEPIRPTIRPERPADHAAIARVVADAFGSPAEAGLVEAIRDSDAYLPELALVAELDGAVVGHVMISYVGLEDEAGTRRPIPSLSPLAVAPPEAAQVLRLRQYDPTLVGRVVYPPAFDAFAEH